jgi:hypothetical protein
MRRRVADRSDELLPDMKPERENQEVLIVAIAITPNSRVHRRPGSYRAD